MTWLRRGDPASSWASSWPTWSSTCSASRCCGRRHGTTRPASPCWYRCATRPTACRPPCPGCWARTCTRCSSWTTVPATNRPRCCSTGSTPGPVDSGRARVVTGAATPPGWAGKTWAMQQLGAAAAGDVLVFCDADVRLAPGAIDAVRAEMQRQHADVFSVFPRQMTATIGEHLLVPLIDDVLLCFLPFPLLAAPVPSAATANGSLIAFDRQRIRGPGRVRRRARGRRRGRGHRPAHPPPRSPARSRARR